MNFRKFIFFIYLFILLGNKELFCNEFDSTKTYKFAQINIYANSVYNIYKYELNQKLVTDDKTIKSYNVSALPDIFNGSTSVYMQKTNYGGGSPILRGMIGNRVLILIDGIKLNNSTFRYGPNQYFNTINPHIVKKIEVISGAAAVNYGSDALGGVINVITKTDLEDNTASFYSQYSSADRGFYQNAEISHKISDFTLYGSMAYKKVADLKAGNGKIQNPSGYKSYDLFFKVGYQIDSTILIKFNYQKNNSFDVPRTDRYTAGNDIKYLFNPQKRELYSLSNSYFNSNGFLNLIETSMFLIKQEEGREIISKKSSNTQTNDLDKVQTLGFINKINFGLLNFYKGIIGIEYYSDNVLSKRLNVNLNTGDILKSKPQFADDSEVSNLGIFIKNKFLIDRFNIELGIRYANYKVTANLLEPFNLITLVNNSILFNAGLSYNLIIDKLLLNLNYSQGYRNPGLEDLTVYGKSGSGNGARFDAPNPDLLPEFANNYEIGFKFFEEDITSSLYFYYTQLSDFIIPVKGLYLGQATIEGYPVYIRKNIEKGYIAGSEWYLYLKLINKLIIQNQLNYTYGYNKTNKEPLSRIPPLNGKLTFLINYKYLFGEYYLIWGANQKELSAADKIDFRIGNNGTAGFVTHNLAFSYYYKNIGVLYLRIENIFDKYYKYHGSGISAPGRNFVVATDIKI